MNVFQPQVLKKPSFIQNIFSQKVKDNALIEINNLLASNQGTISKLSVDEIISIAEKYKVNLKSNFKQQRLTLFHSFLKHCLNDAHLTEKEIEELKHLRDILLLSENDTLQIFKLETEKIYEKEVQDAVKDGKIEDHEKQKLEQLKSNLLIPEDTASRLYDENAKGIMQKFVDGILSDGLLSPEEEKDMHEIAKSLNIDIKISDKTQAVLDKYKLFWQIEKGELPVISSDINLPKSETLHFRTRRLQWMEQRTITKRINYGGPTARIRIAKGIYYSAGSLAVNRVSEDIWKTIDSGPVYLTNKRLIFMGSKGNKTIRLNKILNISPFKNGVDIQKDSGKSPFLSFDENVDLFSMILVRLMDEQ